MAFWDRVKDFFVPQKKSLNILQDLFGEGPGESFWGNKGFIDAYSKSLYVYACVSKIAEKCSSVEFNLFKIIDLQGNTDEILEHPILDLLYRPNPFYTKEEFIMTDVINRKLTGDSFILKIRNKNGEVAELWNLRPDLITIVSSPENYIDYYEMTLPNGKKERIAKEDIIHIKYPSPLLTLDGHSPLSVVKSRVETEEYATRFQKNFFLNNARPDAIIEVENSLSKEQMEQLLMSWEQRHRGADKGSKVGILTGGAKYQQISLSQREMDFIESLKFTRDDILVAFKVPKPIVAITDDVNRANAETAMEIFINETIIPELNLLTNKLNEELVIPDFGEEYYLEFEDITPRNDELKLNELSTGIDRWITINEVREEYGLPPVQGGDNLYRALSVMPVASTKVKTEEQSKNYRKLHGKKGLRIKLKIMKEVEDEVKRIRQKTKDILTNNSTKQYHSHSLLKDINKRKMYQMWFNKSIDKKKEKIKQLVKNWADKEEKSIISKLEKNKPKDKKEIRKLLDAKDARKRLEEFLTPVFFALFEEAGNEIMNIIRPDKPFRTEGKANKGKLKTKTGIKDLLVKRIAFVAKEVVSTTIERLVDNVWEGIKEGESIPQLSDRVKDVFDQFDDFRAETISRTEACCVENYAHLEAYEQSDVVEEKEWIATLDDRVRDSHLMLDGETRPIDEPFSNGLMFPGDPSGDPDEIINCRCAIAPIVKYL